MNFLETRLYRWMEVLGNLFLLNLLWLVAAAPLITLFPATAALFAVVRGWIRGTETDLWQPFWRGLRENFGQSLLIGLLWTLLGLILLADFLFVRSITSWISIPLWLLFALIILVYLATTVYLFPIMVHYRAGWWQVIRNSFLLAGAAPVLTLKCLLIVTLAVVVFFYFPVSFLISGSVTAYLIYERCDDAFARFETMVARDDDENP
jgi:uncharacterized membrane protein YesL